MTQVFENAQGVFAWLGPAAVGTEELMHSLQREGKKFIERAWARFQEDHGVTEESPHLDVLPTSEL